MQLLSTNDELELMQLELKARTRVSNWQPLGLIRNPMGFNVIHNN